MKMVRELLKCQIHDPDKGSFLVNPQPVKREGAASIKRKICSDGLSRPVYRAGHYKDRDGKRGSAVMVPHPEAMDFVIMDGEVY